MVSPTARSAAAIAAASTGWLMEKRTTTATSPSSVRLAPMFVAGSGEVLMASRSPAFTAWLASATIPLNPAPKASWIPSIPCSPPNWKPRTTAISGLITVWKLSQRLSSPGTLSTKNSTRKSASAAAMTGVFSRSSGTAPTLSRPRIPSRATVP